MTINDAKQKIFDFAKSRNGYLEKSRSAYNSNRNIVYSLTDGAGNDNITECWEDVRKAFQGNPWCQCYAYWLFMKVFGDESAQKMLYIDKWSVSDAWNNFDCTSWAQNFENNKARYQSSKAEPGDLVFFTNGKRAHHVELVIAVDNDYIYTNGGNTSSESKVIPNGGSVVDGKKYKKGINEIYCYGRPNWSIIANGSAIENKSASYPVISRGYNDGIMGGNYCKTMQIGFNKLGITDHSKRALQEDGSCGKCSNEAIYNFQKKYDLEKDYKFGPACWSMLNEMLSINKKGFKVTVTTELNCRAGAGVLNKIICKLKKGSTYTVIDINNGWYYLKEAKGWASAKYLSK